MDGKGTVGIAPNVNLLVIKAEYSHGSFRSSDLIFGIYYAVEAGADVINMSFGSYYDSGFADAVQFAIDHGVKGICQLLAFLLRTARNPDSCQP